MHEESLKKTSPAKRRTQVCLTSKHDALQRNFSLRQENSDQNAELHNWNSP
jgi:hypothetical protein